MKGISAVGGIAMFVSMALVGTGRAQAADNVTLQLDWVPGGIAGGWYYGIKHHCFSDRGINLKVMRGYGSADAVAKVATGASDFGVTDLGAMIASRAKTGALVKGVLPIMSDSPFGVVVMNTSPIHTLKDLEGKRVAAAPGDASMQFLPIGMKLAGADFAKITPVPTDQATLAGLLIQGKVDAITNYVTSGISVDDAAKQVGKKARIIPFGQKLEIYNASLFTSDKMIQQKPDLVARFHDASICAYDGSRKDLNGTIDAMVDQISGMPRESQVDLVPFSYKLAFDSPTFKKYGYKWNLKRVSHTIDIVKIAQNISTPVTPNSVVYEAK